MNKSHLIGEDWNELLESEFDKDYLKELSLKLGWLYKNHPNKIVPDQDQLFRAFKETRLNNIKVVIVGSSPYPSKIHATGRAFATYSKYITGTIEKILYSIDRDVMFGLDISKRCYLDCINEKDYSLQHWVDQGILLLNANLTTEVGNPKAHQGYGWENFICAALDHLQTATESICFLAWGSEATRIMSPIFDDPSLFSKHLYLSCEHPVNAIHQNRPWNNNNCFKKVNQYLEQNNKELISW